jgi:hypothetical protein
MFPPNTVEASPIDRFSDLFTCYDDTCPDAGDEPFTTREGGRHILELPSGFAGLRTNDHRLHGLTDDYDVFSQLVKPEESVEPLAHPQALHHPYSNDHELCSIQELISHSADVYWPTSQQVAEDTQMNSRPGTGSTWLSSGSNSDSSGSQDNATMHFEQFCQGRTLLQASGSRGTESMLPVSQAEADVAKTLKGHWQPNRL